VKERRSLLHILQVQRAVLPVTPKRARNGIASREIEVENPAEKTTFLPSIGRDRGSSWVEGGPRPSRVS